MARKSVETEILGVKVTTTPLEYKLAEDHLPEVGLIFARVVERAVQEMGPSLAKLTATSLKDMTAADLGALAPAVAPIMKEVLSSLGGGALKRLVPVVLRSTVAIVTAEDGQPEKRELMKESDRAKLFEEHPGTYFPILFFAGRVTWGPFFPVRELIARAMQKMKETMETAESTNGATA